MSRALKAGFTILKMGAVRGNDSFRTPGRLHTTDAPECEFCGADAYETELKALNGAGAFIIHCPNEQCQQEAMWQLYDAAVSDVEHEEGDM